MYQYVQESTKSTEKYVKVPESTTKYQIVPRRTTKYPVNAP